MLAMLLAACSVYLSRIEEKRPFCWILSGVCICVSCGIYQAYVSFALVLAVLYLMDVLLDNSQDKESCCKWVLRQIITYVISLAAYYVIWKLCMYLTGISANNYQGISEVGQIDAGILVYGLKQSILMVMIYLLQWNVLKDGLSLYAVLHIIFGVILMGVLILSCIKSGIFRRKWAMFLWGLCLVAIIPFACIWYFTSYKVGYGPRMLHSLTLLFVFAALLGEKWVKPIGKNLICTFLILVVGNYSLIANICYFHMNQCYERTYAEGVEMMMDIHDWQDESSFDKIAILGFRNEVMTAGSGVGSFGSIHILSAGLEETLLFNSERTLLFLKRTFGLELQSVTGEEAKALWRLEEVEEMGCWPAKDSMAVIDDVLVIKLSNEEKAE